MKKNKDRDGFVKSIICIEIETTIMAPSFMYIINVTKPSLHWQCGGVNQKL